MTYTVKDVSEITGLSIYTLRYYDKEGLLPFVLRNKSGVRMFTESDIKMVKMICCLKDTGMQIKDIRKYVNLCMEGANVIDSRKKLLSDHKAEILKQIDSLYDNLKLIDSKLETYNSPNAVEIINGQIQKAIDDKTKNLPCYDTSNYEKLLINEEK